MTNLSSKSHKKKWTYENLKIKPTHAFGKDTHNNLERTEASEKSIDIPVTTIPALGCHYLIFSHLERYIMPSPKSTPGCVPESLSLCSNVKEK